jgi:hypothetical protein
VDSDLFKILRIGFFNDVVGKGGEAVVVVIVEIPVGMVPSPYHNDAPSIMAIIDLLPEVDHGSVVKAGHGWSLALRPSITLVAR